MKKRQVQTAVFFLLSLFLVAPALEGKTFIESKKQPLSFEKSLAQGEFQHSQRIFKLAHVSFLAYQSDSIQEEEMADVYGFKGKSLKRAFLYSLIIPGSGELYAGTKMSRIKAALFLGLDITLWALYFNYHGKGKDEEDKYKAFADEHWSGDEYKQWLFDSVYAQQIPYDIVSDTFPYWDPVRNEWVYFSHHLPDKKTQQYYEMIGKYEQFRWGWDDFDGTVLPSLNWDDYRSLREISNDWLNKAKYSAMFSLANHILSAFDAAISVRNYNKRGERFSQIQFKMRLVERDREIIPRLSASLRF